jgi:hypothetical protein
MATRIEKLNRETYSITAENHELLKEALKGWEDTAEFSNEKVAQVGSDC